MTPEEIDKLECHERAQCCHGRWAKRWKDLARRYRSELATILGECVSEDEMLFVARRALGLRP